MVMTAGSPQIVGLSPPWYLRGVVGSLSATLVVGPPVWNWYKWELTGVPIEGIQNVPTITVIMLGVSWLLATILTGYMREDHVLKCVLSGVGLPGIVVAIAGLGQIPT